MDHDKIIDRFGGVMQLSAKLGHKHPTTVRAWYRKKKIPVWRREVVLRLARKRRMSPLLTEQDFETE
tara:strand:+ start:402 stop:602 length:201 start_codon:yes stop_codon:yes gene_type:complete